MGVIRSHKASAVQGSILPIPTKRATNFLSVYLGIIDKLADVIAYPANPSKNLPAKSKGYHPENTFQVARYIED